MNGKNVTLKLNGIFENTGGNVYCVIIGDLAIGPFLFDGTPWGEIEAYNEKTQEYVPMPEGIECAS